jgi:hypothetical protein
MPSVTRAIDEVLAGYEGANTEASLVGKRWGIEHAFIGRPRSPAADEGARTPLIAAGTISTSRGPSLVKYWGPGASVPHDTSETVSRCRVASVRRDDSSVVPYSPLWVIYPLRDARHDHGGPMGVDQKISREDALRMVTRNHWYLTFEETPRGHRRRPLRRHGRLPEDIMIVPRSASSRCR